MKKNLILILILAAAIIGGFYFFSGKDAGKTSSDVQPGAPAHLSAADLMRRKGLTVHPREKRDLSAPVQPAAADPLAADDQKSKDDMSKRDGCILGLIAIEEAKTKWAIAHNKSGGDHVSVNDIYSYLTDGALPTCPAGGEQSLNDIGIKPSCNIAGHVMP